MTITGTNFTGATAVKFGVTAATSFTVNSATLITATSPAGSGRRGRRHRHDAGRHQRHRRRRPVHLRAPAPTVTGVARTAGPTAGGTSVTITGTNFTGATAVKFGATAAAPVHGHTARRSITGDLAGRHAAGAVDVTVTDAGRHQRHRRRRPVHLRDAGADGHRRQRRTAARRPAAPA